MNRLAIWASDVLVELSLDSWNNARQCVIRCRYFSTEARPKQQSTMPHT